MKPMRDGERGRGMGRTKFCHLLWWQVSDDEQSVEVYSVIQLALFGYPITLSKRGFKMPCHYEEEGVDNE